MINLKKCSLTKCSQGNSAYPMKHFHSYAGQKSCLNTEVNNFRYEERNMNVLIFNGLKCFIMKINRNYVSCLQRADY